MFHIALFEPCIAPNTGNIIRLSANNGCKLHLIEPLGFELSEKQLRRAGLDYNDLTSTQIYPNYWSFKETIASDRIFACTTKGSVCYSDVAFQPGDIFLFGAETHGLSDAVMESIPEAHRIKIPMMPNNRSLNLSNSVAIITYEAWRQNEYNLSQKTTTG